MLDSQAPCIIRLYSVNCSLTDKIVEVGAVWNALPCITCELRGIPNSAKSWYTLAVFINIVISRNAGKTICRRSLAKVTLYITTLAKISWAWFILTYWVGPEWRVRYSGYVNCIARAILLTAINPSPFPIRWNTRLAVPIRIWSGTSCTPRMALPIYCSIYCSCTTFALFTTTPAIAKSTRILTYVPSIGWRVSTNPNSCIIILGACISLTSIEPSLPEAVLIG